MEHRLYEGALQLAEGRWLDLEDGVQVFFSGAARYRSGESWLIPARTVGGQVEWPRDPSGEPLVQPPFGPAPAFAPLA
jgi:hypothetical protein